MFKKSKTSMKTSMKVFYVVLILFIVVAVVAVTAIALYTSGKIRKPSFIGTTTILDTPNTSSSEIDKENVPKVSEDNDNVVMINGQKMIYNPDIITILCLGIDDKNNPHLKPYKQWGASGQCDAIMLGVLDIKTKKAKLINISRDTMTKIKKFSIDGKYLGDTIDHISLGWSAGDGSTESAKAMQANVSNLFYGININAYCALNITGVSDINDLVGGITVSISDDTLNLSPYYLKKGTKVTLKGDLAEFFVRRRDTETDGSNINRMNNQKLYISAFMDKVKSVAKENPMILPSLYDTAKKYICTDISADYATYLGVNVIGTQFGMENMISLKGENNFNNTYNEFYVDEKELKKLVAETFYLPYEVTKK